MNAATEEQIATLRQMAAGAAREAATAAEQGDTTKFLLRMLEAESAMMGAKSLEDAAAGRPPVPAVWP